MNDAKFVLSAYQASQIAGFLNNDESWSQMFSTEQVRKIDSVPLRNALVRLLSFNWQAMHWSWVDSDYRQHVRGAIPDDVQQAIRDQCDDFYDGEERIKKLSLDCEFEAPADRIAAAASELRAHPELASMLRWHIANIASYHDNMVSVETSTLALKDEIEKVN